MTETTESVFQGPNIPDDLKPDFVGKKFITNFNRYRAFCIVALPIYGVLLILDLMNRAKGFWVEPAYRALFQVHLVMFALVITLTIAFFPRPLLVAGAVTRRHKAMVVILTSAFVFSQLFITFADLQITGQITSYVIMAFMIGALVLWGPFESAVIYATGLILFVSGLAYILDDPGQRYGHILNGSILTLLAWALSRVVYAGFRRDFMHGLEAERKNENIRTMAERLRLSEMEYRHLFEHSPVGIFRTNLAGRVIAANPSALETLKFDSLDAINGAGLLNLYVDPADRDRLVSMVRQGTVTGFETVLRRGDGQCVPLSVSAFLELDETGHPLYLEGTIEDITERRKLEAQREEAAEALRRSEERYRLLAENSGDVIVTLDLDFRVTYMSPAVGKLLGGEPGQLMGRSAFDDLTPSSVQRAMEEYNRISPEIEKGNNPISHLELEQYRQDRSTVWVEVTMRPMRDDQGRLTGYVGVSRDISERKRMEALREEAAKALRESEEKYKFLVENTSDIIWIFDLTTMTYSYCSNSVERILGYTVDESIGMRMDDIFSPETNKVVQDYFRRIVTGKESPNRTLMEAECIAKNGGRVWVEINAVAKRDELGKIVGFFGVTRDISERKRMEALREEAAKALRESEEKYRLLAENIDDVIFTLDKELCFTYISPSSFKLRGVPAEEAMQEKLEEIMTPESLNKVFAEYARVIDEVEKGLNPTVRIEIEQYHRDGSTLWVEISLRIMWDNEGRLTGFAGAARDISGRKRTEEALQLRNILLSTQQEVSIDGILVVDDKGVMISFNRRFAEIWGIPQDILESKSDELALRWVLGNLTDPEEFISKVRHLYENRSETSRDEIALKDGRTLDRYSAPMFGDGGRYYGRIWYFRDITERKHAEQELRESQRRLADIIDFLPLATLVIDRRGRVTAWNRAMETLTGVQAADMIGKGDFEYALPFYGVRRPILIDLVFDPEEDILAGQYKDIQYERGVLTAEAFIPKLGSDGIICLGFATALNDATGNVVGAIESIRDITKMRKVEAELKEAEEKYRTILESMDSGYYEVDLQGNMLFCNPALRKFLGYDETEVKGLNFRDYMDEEEATRVFRIFNEVFNSGQASGDFYWRFSKKGSPSAYSAASVYPVMNDQGDIVGFRGTVRDITAIKEAKDAADAANRSKSIFLANMSHEIRTPMNAILGFAQLLDRDPDLSPQSREYLDIINRSGEHLLSLINDILEMSKIEAGRATFIPNTFDLHSLLEDIERMFRPRADAKNLRLMLEMVGPVPRWVVTDEGKLRQVLINLLGNAVKFTEEGGIALRLGVKAGKADTVNLQFEVEDTGPGMTEEEIGRLFQVFEQTRAGVKSGGTGLGLALSRGFIQIMGGTISVASAVGQGTTFRFDLPVREGLEEKAPHKITRRRVIGLSSGQGEIRVLIADDRETNRQLLSRLLGRVGFATRDVVNGEEALRAVREWNPRVVLMDMTMPVMDGYEATRAIKASPDGKKTVIIAVTASAFEEDKQRIIASGADDYLSKPFKEEELFEKIGRLTGADYQYEEAGVMEKASARAEDLAPTHRLVAALPPDLVDRMRQAVESADLDLLNDLVGKWAADHPALAKQTREMAARYEYETLIALFSPGG
ncbi:MAG: PAS domain S-box protein [Thermodesulfobacteriota bacterium]